MTKNTAFWDDLARDLEDPEFLREYIVESMQIATIDQVVNAIDDVREAAGKSQVPLPTSSASNARQPIGATAGSEPHPGRDAGGCRR
jgi:hypothetical protein